MNFSILSIKRWHVILFIILIVLPLGLLSKSYTGTGSQLIANKLAGTIYVIFWSLITSLIFSKKPTLFVCLFVLVITCLLEFLQLYSNQFLEIIRSTFLGRALIGSSFSWSDFGFYLLGFFLSWFTLHIISILFRNN